jgi:hypothetical protein
MTREGLFSLFTRTALLKNRSAEPSGFAEGDAFFSLHKALLAHT